MKTITIIMVLAALFVTGLWGQNQMILRQQAEEKLKESAEAYKELDEKFDVLESSINECFSLKGENEFQYNEIEYLRELIGTYMQAKEELDRKDKAIEEQKITIDTKEKEILTLKKSLDGIVTSDHKISMTLTAYTLSYDECGPDLTPALSTSKCVVGETAAVSPDLSSWLGKFVYIEGFGVRYVNDLTDVRFRNRVDILVASKKEAFNIGCKRGIVVCPFDM